MNTNGTPGAGLPVLDDDLKTLPLPPTGERVLMFDSHDVTGFNDDGFSAACSYRYRSPKGWVLFDHTGPGTIKLIRTMGFRGRLLLFLDRDHETDEPSLAVPFTRLYSGKDPRFPAHLVADLAKGHGSEWCYVPFHFGRRGTVIAAGEDETAGPTASTPGPHFYTITANVGPTMHGSRRTDHAPETVRLPAAAAPASRCLKGSGTLQGFGRLVLLDDRGPGMVAGLRLRLPDRDPEMLAGVFLRATWEGDWTGPDRPPEWESGPPVHVDAPVGLFFATGYGDATGSYTLDHGSAGRHEILLGCERPVSTGVGELADGTRYCRFPMPYWRQAKIELVNTLARALPPVEWELDIAANPYAPGCGHFCAVYHREDATVNHRDYLVAELRGSGHYLGCVMRQSSRKDPTRAVFQRGFLEGDARFFIDDARAFQSASTGTEEYFMWGWYDMLPHDRPFAFASHGYTEHTRDLNDHSTMYRFHLADRVPFYRSFRFELEHGPSGEWTSDCASVAFLYHADRCRLPLSDALDVGDEVGLVSHGYRVTGAMRREFRSLVWEGSPQTRLAGRRRAAGEDATCLEGEGRWVQEVKKGCSFAVAVRPDNLGIRIRRTSDGDLPLAGADVGPGPLARAQEVRVMVDGVETGVWRIPPRIARPCWMEDEFDIDGRTTTGRDHLAIELRCEGDSVWRASGYAIFCLTARPA